MRIGVVVSSVPVAVKLSRPAPWPCWKTHTIAPKVAVRLSRLSTTALIGTSRLPNIRNRVTRVTMAMIPSAHGRSVKMACLESTSWGGVAPDQDGERRRQRPYLVDEVLAGRGLGLDGRHRDRRHPR